MRKINKAEILGCFTGRTRFSLPALLVGFHPFQPTDYRQLKDRLRVLLFSLLNLLALVLFLYAFGKDLLIVAGTYLVSWIALRIVLKVIGHAGSFRFAPSTTPSV